jgi:hypothetical protein
MPQNKHDGRLAGVGHKARKKNLHVNLDLANREPNIVRAHTIALQHIHVVNPYAKKHISDLRRHYRLLGIMKSDNELTKEHNSDFAAWFKAYMH